MNTITEKPKVTELQRVAKVLNIPIEETDSNLCLKIQDRVKKLNFQNVFLQNELNKRDSKSKNINNAKSPMSIINEKPKDDSYIDKIQDGFNNILNILRKENIELNEAMILLKKENNILKEQRDNLKYGKERVG